MTQSSRAHGDTDFPPVQDDCAHTPWERSLSSAMCSLKSHSFLSAC